MANNAKTIELMEEIYEILAEAIDKVPASQTELFLTKLALLMARDAGDATRFKALTGVAALNL